MKVQEKSAEKAYEIVSKRAINTMAVLIALTVTFLMVSTVFLLGKVAETESEITKEVNIFGYPLNRDAAILTLVILVGAIGSLIHLISSFVKYVGAKQFEKSWIIWYLLRPFIGISIALIFYITFRGGFLSGSASSNDINVYGVLTLSALSGMFSKQATEKLNELFSNLFSTNNDDNIIPQQKSKETSQDANSQVIKP